MRTTLHCVVTLLLCSIVHFIMASNKRGVQVRRATSGDYEAVINIIRSFNGPLDYMPTLYQQFVERPTEYAPYVAELDDKVVAFMVFGLDYSNGVASAMGGRVEEKYRGLGLLRLFVHKFLLDYPEKTQCVFDGFLSQGAAEKLKRCLTLYKTNLLWYRANGQLLASWIKSSSARLQQSYDASNTGGYHRELSVDECRLLLSSGQLRRFLSRYAVEYIPLGSGFWEPTEIKNDRQMMSRIRRLRTLATLPACDETQRPTKVNEEFTLNAVSFSGYMEVKPSSWTDGVFGNIFFHGDDTDYLVGHFRDHLRHLVATACCSSDSTDTCRDIHLLVHFPLSFDVHCVDSLIRGKQQRQPSDDVKSTTDCLAFMELMGSGEVYMARELATRL